LSRNLHDGLSGAVELIKEISNNAIINKRKLQETSSSIIGAGIGRGGLSSSKSNVSEMQNEPILDQRCA
jgi:hypothetical protein